MNKKILKTDNNNDNMKHPYSEYLLLACLEGKRYLQAKYHT